MCAFRSKLFIYWEVIGFSGCGSTGGAKVCASRVNGKHSGALISSANQRAKVINRLPHLENPIRVVTLGQLWKCFLK